MSDLCIFKGSSSSSSSSAPPVPDTPDGGSWILPGWLHSPFRRRASPLPDTDHGRVSTQPGMALERVLGAGHKPDVRFFVQKTRNGMGLVKGGKHDGHGGEGCSCYKGRSHDNMKTVEQEIRRNNQVLKQCRRNLPPDILAARTKNLV